jgi:uncharacterized protein
MDVWWLIIMEIYDSEDIKVYMLTKRILFSVMLIVSPSVVASEKAHELYDSIYGGKPAPDVINTLHIRKIKNAHSNQEMILLLF